MKIVPQTGELLVAIQISPGDIDQVRIGQTVTPSKVACWRKAAIGLLA